MQKSNQLITPITPKPWLHGIFRLQNQMGKDEKEILINNFVYSNFNCCPLSGIFILKNRCEKLGRFRRNACKQS